MQKLEYYPVSDLIEYARNPRKNDHAVDRIAAAIREFGFRVPIIAKSDGTIVDGHLRLKAAKKLNLKEVPVLIADDLTEAQIKAFRISVNRMAELAEWDAELLGIEMQEISDLDFDLSLTGFDSETLGKLLDETKDIEIHDDIDEPDVVTLTVECPVELSIEVINLVTDACKKYSEVRVTVNEQV